MAAAASAGNSGAAADWQAVRATADIQYAPVALPKTEPYTPGWLERVFAWLQDLLAPLGRLFGAAWPVMEKVLLVAAVLLVGWLLWRLLGPIIASWLKQRGSGVAAEPEWAPQRTQALALLDEADRLAAAGRFGEAAHLLLQRSVGHIAQARPEWLRPASTAREIATLPGLPARARTAFGAIATRVERSLFALRELDGGDWQAARAAYADFALADLRA